MSARRFTQREALLAIHDTALLFGLECDAADSREVMARRESVFLAAIGGILARVPSLHPPTPGATKP